MGISKQALFTPQAKPLTKYVLPERFGKDQYLMVASLSLDDLRRMREKYKLGTDTADEKGFYSEVLLSTIVDDSGKPFFDSVDEIDRVALTASEFGDLIDFVDKQNGYAKKNSAPKKS